MIYERPVFIAKNSEISTNVLMVPEFEQDFGTPCECQFFINTDFEWDEEFKRYFWLWVQANMEGEVRVFTDGSWIGFTSYNDAFEFMLTW